MLLIVPHESYYLIRFTDLQCVFIYVFSCLLSWSIVKYILLIIVFSFLLLLSWFSFFRFWGFVIISNEIGSYFRVPGSRLWILGGLISFIVGLLIQKAHIILLLVLQFSHYLFTKAFIAHKVSFTIFSHVFSWVNKSLQSQSVKLSSSNSISSPFS